MVLVELFSPLSTMKDMSTSNEEHAQVYGRRGV
jgi:hypothetical protein